MEEEEDLGGRVIFENFLQTSFKLEIETVETNFWNLHNQSFIFEVAGLEYWAIPELHSIVATFYTLIMDLLIKCVLRVNDILWFL